MRTLIAAIALVLALGVALPTETNAGEWGRSNTKWGCTVKATKWYKVLSTTYAAPRIVCDTKRNLIVRTVMWQRMPDGSKAYRAAREVWPEAKPGVPVPLLGKAGTRGVGMSYSMPLIGDAFFFVRVQRVGKPAAIKVKSKERALAW